MGYYFCAKCNAYFNSPYYCHHKYAPEAPVFRKEQIMAAYSVWMYYETDGDAGAYDITLFSTKAKAEAYQIQKNDAYGRVDEIKVDDKVPASPYSAPLCPECDGEMVSRKSQYGTFWGCKKYPKCKGTRDSEGRTKEEAKIAREKERPEPIDEHYRFGKG